MIDPGDVVTTTVTITNNSTAPTPVDATGVQFTETLHGMTIVDQLGDDINVSPIAFDDAYNAAGNITFVAAWPRILNGRPLRHRGSAALNTGDRDADHIGMALSTRRAAASRSMPTAASPISRRPASPAPTASPTR